MVSIQRHKLTCPGELTIEDLQDGCCGCHRGYCNNMFLAILNLNVTPMPPIKFWLNLTYHSGADEVLTSSHKLCFEQKYEKYQKFISKTFHVFGSKIFSIFE